MFYFLIDPGDIISDDPKAHHHSTSNKKHHDQKCGIAFHRMPGKIPDQRINQKEQGAPKAAHSTGCYKLQRKCCKCHDIPKRIADQRSCRPFGFSGLTLLHLKGTEMLLKPIQDDAARKNMLRSGMARTLSTAFLSSSLKSEAFSISKPVARDMIR